MKNVNTSVRFVLFRFVNVKHAVHEYKCLSPIIYIKEIHTHTRSKQRQDCSSFTAYDKPQHPYSSEQQYYKKQAERFTIQSQSEAQAKKTYPLETCKTVEIKKAHTAQKQVKSKKSKGNELNPNQVNENVLNNFLMKLYTPSEVEFIDWDLYSYRKLLWFFFVAKFHKNVSPK